jgi:tripartite-type tricarboxylate transporter receptor subunit TctC
MLAGCVVSAATMCWAQTRSGDDAAKDYPSRPVRIIAQFQPGTTTDIIARLIGQRLTEAWGQQVVIDNRAGAGGVVGTEIGAKATPDGYTLTMGVSGAFGIAPGLYAKLPYDVVRDFAPITNVVTQAQVLIASTAVPAKSVTEVVEMAKAKPGALNYASVGAGTATHLTMEMLQSFAKVRLNHIPFKGSPAAHIELIGGQVHFMFDGLPAALPQIRSGKLRGIAVSTAQRQQYAPDLPTVAQSGYPGFDAAGWAGLVAPAKTPAPILDKLNREMVRIINTPETRERLIGMGFNPVGDTRAQYAEFIKAEIAKWRRVVNDAGVKVE